MLKIFKVMAEHFAYFDIVRFHASETAPRARKRWGPVVKDKAAKCYTFPNVVRHLH